MEREKTRNFAIPIVKFKFFIMGLNLKLFTTFFKIGMFTFGGGWAMISIVQREVVDKNKWLTNEEFLDLITVTQSLPGILAVNMSVVIGDRLSKLKGSLAAAFGTILPSFLIILAIAIFLTPETIKNNDILTRIFMGIRPAVVALILVPVITTAKASKINYKTALIPISVAILIWLGLPVISNPILYIFLGGIGGYLYYKHKQYNELKESQK